MALLDVSLSNLVVITILTETLMGVTSIPITPSLNKEDFEFTINETDGYGVARDQGQEINHNYVNLMPPLSPNLMYEAPSNYQDYVPKFMPETSNKKQKKSNKKNMEKYFVKSTYPYDLKRCNLQQLARIKNWIQNYDLEESLNRLIDCDFIMGSHDLYNAYDYNDELILSKSHSMRREQRELMTGRKAKKRIFGMEVLDVVGQAVPTTTPLSYTIKVIDSALLPPNYKAFKNYFTHQEGQGQNESNRGAFSYRESAKYMREKQPVVKANGLTDTNEINNLKMGMTGLGGSNREKSLEELLAKLDRKLKGPTKSLDNKNSVNSGGEDYYQSQGGIVLPNNGNAVQDNLYNYMDSKKNWKMLRWLQARMNQSG